MSWLGTKKFLNLRDSWLSPIVREARDVLVPDIQARPVTFKGAAGALPHALKVDVALQLDGWACIAGWCNTATPLSLQCGGEDLHALQVRTTRTDVAKHFNLASGSNLGFLLVAACNGTKPIRVAWRDREDTIRVSRALRLIDASEIRPDQYALLDDAISGLARDPANTSMQWIDLIRRIPRTTMGPRRYAKGHIESAVVCARTNQCVVAGWVTCGDGNDIWLESDSGVVCSVEESFRYFRQDVHDAWAHEAEYAASNAGFVAYLKGMKPNSRVRMKTGAEDGNHVLSEIQCSVLPSDPAAAARHLFGIATPISEFSQRIRKIDTPVLEPLIARRREMLGSLTSQHKQLGTPVTNPAVTVIVPLYGRADLVEHQLIEFARDPWMVNHAELIYVLDDPRLVDSFKAQAEALGKLYRVPFSWVWGGINRGFAGANNLGAACAQADRLLFLNSDVFPLKPGWVEPLLDVLATRHDIGAVAPRLLFGDGSIQHCGMEFRRRDDLGIWINHHPLMGLDPILDPHQSLAIVPAVTGACVVMRRADFDRVGGWDTGYLIADFEDSDLCLKLRAKGLEIAYLPTVELTHLERQSFKLAGDSEFRLHVTIYNAVRHQQRWEQLIHTVPGEECEGTARLQ